MGQLSVLSLFSGIGAHDYGFRLAGLKGEEVDQ